MFKHYLTTALRHFRQHKLTTSINVVCLTIGLVCFLASYAMVAYFSSADRHFANADRVYMITQQVNSTPTTSFGSWATAKYLKSDFPELETVARATLSSPMFNDVPISAGDRKGFVHVAYADPEFLEVFSLPFLTGVSTSALRSPRSAVISNETAVRFFGDAAAAIGRRLRLQDGREITVRGVVGALKQPSHISTTSDLPLGLVRFDVLISTDVFEAEASSDPVNRRLLTNWNMPVCFTYVVLPKDGSLTAADLRQRLEHFGKRHADSPGSTFTMDAAPLSDYSLSLFGTFFSRENPRGAALLVFLFLGGIVLFASCLNYANLATAQATTHAKEIGMRRIVGARSGQIAVQFMLEAALLSVVALLVAILLIAGGLIALSLPGSNGVVAWVIASPSFWLTLFCLLSAVTIVAGLYPAFVLSRVRPINAVRSGKQRNGGRFVPHLLVGLQFSVASFLLISMLVMTQQNAALRNSIVSGTASTLIEMSNDIRAAGVDYDLLRSELLRQPHVLGVTASALSPWSTVAQPSKVTNSRDRIANAETTTQNGVQLEFFSTMDIQVLAGRTFVRDYADDISTSIENPTTQRPTNVVIDRALAEHYGWTNPADAIGKTLYAISLETGDVPPKPRTIVGVVENHAMSVISPFGSPSNMYLFMPTEAIHPIIRVATADGAAALEEIESVWNKLAPEVALRMQFADSAVNRNHQIFNVIARVFSGIAALALLVSVLGLIGMSLHVIGRRQHEIGVRKTLGASVRNIVQLLLADFSRPVIAANVLAWPMAFLGMEIYLKAFTHRVELSSAPFVSGLVITLLIAWMAVALQATRAAKQNPAKVLRAE